MSAFIWTLITSSSVVVVIVSASLFYYWDKRVKAILKEEGTVADLAAKVVVLKEEKTHRMAWLDANKEELLKLDGQRKEQEVLKNELAALKQKNASEEQKQDDIRKEATALQNTVSNLSENRDHLKDKTRELDKQNEVLLNEQNRLQIEKQQLDIEVQRQKESLKQLEEAEKVYKQLQKDISDLKETRDKLQAKGIDLSNQIKESEAEIQRKKEEQKTTEKQAQEFEKKSDALLEELTEIQAHKKGLLADKKGLLTVIEEKENKKESLDRTIAILEIHHTESEEKNKKLQADIQKLEPLQEQVKESEYRLNSNKRDVEALEQKKTNLEQNIARLEARSTEFQDASSANEGSYIDLLEKPPECLSEDHFSEELKEADEEQLLAQFKDNLSREGFYFSERVIKAFHTSLKVSRINPLIVLAGVSGTGKSLLPIKYAEAMGMHNLIVSVQPRWDAPQDLFGFYNYLENKYKATDLARALVRMDEFNFAPSDFEQLEGQKRDDRMLLVLLDEMNLARTEYYFSEFLSKLEIRRLVGDPTDRSKRTKSEIELDVGPRDKEDESFRLWVGNNVLFVGTMNEDESTQTLSDKVLDRANVLRFGRPPANNKDHKKAWKPPKAPYLKMDQWDKWCKDDSSQQSNPWDGDLQKWIGSLNEALDSLGRPFGYRIQEGIQAYVNNYPGVNKNGVYKTAFADQVEQKIIPKLRGTNIHDPNLSEALDEIQKVVDQLEDEALIKAFQKSRDVQDGMFVWRGVTRET